MCGRRLNLPSVGLDDTATPCIVISKKTTYTHTGAHNSECHPTLFIAPSSARMCRQLRALPASGKRACPRDLDPTQSRPRAPMSVGRAHRRVTPTAPGPQLRPSTGAAAPGGPTPSDGAPASHPSTSIRPAAVTARHRSSQAVTGRHGPSRRHSVSRWRGERGGVACRLYSPDSTGRS